MKIKIKRSQFIGVLVFMSLLLSVNLNAQTPADDPGIGGPGSTGFSPASDGAPTVPFDGGMSLILLASGIGYLSKKIQYTYD